MTPPHGYADSSRGTRLQKVLAEAGVASRRACETLIEEGAVSVNGEMITELPAWVDPDRDKIVVNGRIVRVPRGNTYVMLFKPRGVVTTSSDPEGRRTASELVQHPTKNRLFAVGRLDMDTSGLLLMTNDGELTNRLTHPRYELPKVYEVTVKGAVEDETLERLERGIVLHDRGSSGAKRTSKSSLRIQRRDRDRTLLIMEIREGRNRQIRRMMADVGHPVKKLRRVRMGPLRLKGLAPGQWRDLLPAEVASLKRAAFRK